MHSPRGFTLMEVLVSLVMSVLVLLSFSSLFVVEHNVRQHAQDTITVTREARMAVNHMADVLRFAYPDTVGVTENPAVKTVTATIAGGHLSFIEFDTPVTYIYSKLNHSISYTQSGRTIVIANNINLPFNIDVSNLPDITITITAVLNKVSVTLQTEVRSIID